MGQPTYYYNSETCQYEPVKLRWIAALSYCFLLIVASAAIWAGFLLLYGKVFPTQKAQALKKENIALEAYYAGVESELAGSKQLLAQINAEEQLLYTKLFNESEEGESSVNQESDFTFSLSAGHTNDFKNAFDIVQHKFDNLKTKSVNGNVFYGERITISQDDLTIMMSLPSLPPVDLSLVTTISGFGQRINPFHKGTYFHPGADFAAVRGSNVVAAGDGKVIRVSRSNIQAGYGNYIEIDHGNKIVTLYAHLDEIDIRYGQKVKKGDVIGLVGSSGGSIAPHLHFEVFRDGEQVDPLPYLIQKQSSSGFARMIEDGKKKNQSLD